jgi:membrane associated rhomboid family serine protease
MIPLRDVIPSRTTPWINLLLIGANVLVFLYECLLNDHEAAQFFLTYGLVPVHFSWIAATTSMFVHANWLHVGSNLLSLWIFGDNVEDRMGHGRYLAFYLLAGYAGGLLEVWVQPASTVPLVGASGAIAGVMGAYLMLFPYSRVLVLIPIIIFFDVVEIPAIIFLGIWFVLQLVGGVGRIPETTSAGGVAFWAHLGGFLPGVSAVWLFRRPERQRVEWWGA